MIHRTDRPYTESCAKIMKSRHQDTQQCMSLVKFLIFSTHFKIPRFLPDLAVKLNIQIP